MIRHTELCLQYLGCLLQDIFCTFTQLLRKVNLLCYLLQDLGLLGEHFQDLCLAFGFFRSEDLLLLMLLVHMVSEAILDAIGGITKRTGKLDLGCHFSEIHFLSF